jgi:hypothetical protein
MLSPMPPTISMSMIVYLSKTNLRKLHVPHFVAPRKVYPSFVFSSNMLAGYSIKYDGNFWCFREVVMHATVSYSTPSTSSPFVLPRSLRYIFWECAMRPVSPPRRPALSTSHFTADIIFGTFWIMSSSFLFAAFVYDHGFMYVSGELPANFPNMLFKVGVSREFVVAHGRAPPLHRDEDGTLGQWRFSCRGSQSLSGAAAAAEPIGTVRQFSPARAAQNRRCGIALCMLPQIGLEALGACLDVCSRSKRPRSPFPYICGHGIRD